MGQEQIDLPDVSNFHFRRNFVSFDHPMHLLSPIQGQKPKSGNENVYILSDLSLPEIARALQIPIENEAAGRSFMQHQQRYKTYEDYYVLFSWVTYLLIATFVVMLVLVALAVGGMFSSDTPKDLPAYFYIAIFVFAYFVFKLATRIVSALFDRYYADTLSFVTCLYLLSALAMENSLAEPKHRKQLLFRTRALRKYLVLLPHQFLATNLPAKSWARAHFRSLTLFIDEKENQIIAPQANTQVTIFRELQTLLQVLWNDNYGEFNYNGSTDPDIAASPASTGSNFTNILKLLGTITPLALLVAILLFPRQFSFLGFETKVISYISLAWLLLAIDANLKLGIVQGLSSLAKTIKDLS